MSRLFLLIDPAKPSGVRATLAAVLTLLVAACAEPVPLPQPPDIPHGQGRLWQVEGEDIETSYVFGTMHVTDPRVFELPEPVETAFVGADIALFEADYRRRASSEERRPYIVLPEGRSLIDVVGRSTYKKLQNLIFRHRLRITNYFSRQPWVSWMALSDREIDIAKQYDSEKPILDDWLILRARKAQREVGFLEKNLEQWEAFAGIPMDDQVAMLRSAIDTYYDRRLRVDRVAVYVDGNLALSYALWGRWLSHLDPAVAQRFTDRLINDRNRRMVERMLPYMEKRSAFVAVGALHLPGEEGILALLEREGYTVTRLH